MSLTEMVSSLIWRSRRMTSRCRKNISASSLYHLSKYCWQIFFKSSTEAFSMSALVPQRSAMTRSLSSALCSCSFFSSSAAFLRRRVRSFFLRSLKERNAESVSELLGGVEIHDLLGGQITLVSDQQFVDVLTSVTIDFLKPLLDVAEGGLISHIVHNDNTVGTSVVRRSDCSETLLTGSIPNLKFNRFASNLDSSNLEVDTNGTDVGLCVGIISETQKKARFVDTTVTNEQEFEEMIVFRVHSAVEKCLGSEGKPH